MRVPRAGTREEIRRPKAEKSHDNRGIPRNRRNTAAAEPFAEPFHPFDAASVIRISAFEHSCAMHANSMELAAWVGCLFFVVAGWNQVEKFFDRRAQRGAQREIQPQPLAVTKFDSPVVETLCQSRRSEFSNEILRLEHELGGLRGDRRADVAELQQKINKVDREVGELRASIELNNQQLTRIDAKLDRVIERQNP